MQYLQKNEKLIEGFDLGRKNGRDLEEFRPICFIPKVLTTVPGSAYASYGNSNEKKKTEVIATVIGPKPSMKSTSHKGELEISIQYLSATHKSSPEESRVEAQVRQCFESVILLSQYPKSRIEISVIVVQSNGEVFSAIINAISLALLHSNIACCDIVSSASAYYVKGPMEDGYIIVDLDSDEEEYFRSNGKTCSRMNLCMCYRSKTVATLTSSGGNLSQDILEELLAICELGCGEIAQEMKKKAIASFSA